MNILKKNIYVVGLFLLVVFVYVIFAGRLKFEFPLNPYNYYSHQVYSFLHGKLSLFSTSSTHDLSIYNGKKYMYWGPSPIFFISPFVILFGLNFSDALYTAIISSFAPVVLWLILKELDKVGLIRTSSLLRLLLCLFFSFGTVFFVLSVNGGVWFTSQAINTLYLLISLLFLFRFVNKYKSGHNLVLSSFFLGLAIWGRSSLILYLPLFLFNIYLTFKARKLQKSQLVKNICIFSAPLILFFMIFCTYNFLRFHNIFESGYSYHLIDPRFIKDRQKYGEINIHYIPRNFYYMFLNFPGQANKFPYFNFDQEGDSVLFTSPLFILLILGLKKYFRDFRKNLFQVSILLTTVAIIFSLLVFFGTGWIQFGYRYLLDAIPLMIILLADVIKKVSLFILISLVAFSIIVNILGVLWLFSL
jgi:hypothetical protein